MKDAGSNDIVITLDGIGEFRYREPSIRDLMKIDKEYAAMVNGIESPGMRYSVLATMISIHKATSVSAPAGWENLEALSGRHDNDVANLLVAYREKEDSFRNGKQP